MIPGGNAALGQNPSVRRIDEHVLGHGGAYPLPEHLDLELRACLDVRGEVREPDVAGGGEPVARAPEPADDLAARQHRLASVDRHVLVVSYEQRAEPPRRTITRLCEGATSVELTLFERDAEAERRLVGVSPAVRSVPK
jgi:hypothetical protein